MLLLNPLVETSFQTYWRIGDRIKNPKHRIRVGCSRYSDESSDYSIWSLGSLGDGRIFKVRQRIPRVDLMGDIYDVIECVRKSTNRLRDLCVLTYCLMVDGGASDRQAAEWIGRARN